MQENYLFDSSIRDNIAVNKPNAKMDEVIQSYEKITDELFEELEEILIMGDVGMETSEKIIFPFRL